MKNKLWILIITALLSNSVYAGFFSELNKMRKSGELEKILNTDYSAGQTYTPPAETYTPPAKTYTPSSSNYTAVPKGVEKPNTYTSPAGTYTPSSSNYTKCVKLRNPGWSSDARLLYNNCNVDLYVWYCYKDNRDSKSCNRGNKKYNHISSIEANDRSSTGLYGSVSYFACKKGDRITNNTKYSTKFGCKKR